MTDLQYIPDILAGGFEQLTFNQPDDYEGKVTCTLVRKKAETPTNKAVLYVHGFNDYFFQHEMALNFNEQGYDFYALDLRKYGRSWLPHQKLNNVRDISEYYADLDRALLQIREEGHGNVLLSGHSTGGLVGIVYAADRPGSDLFSALFVTSPNFVFNENIILRKLALPLMSAAGGKWPDKLIPGGFSPLYGPSLHKESLGEWSYNLSWKPHVAPLVNCGFIRAIYRAQRRVSKNFISRLPLQIMISDTSLYEKKWSDKLFAGDVILNVTDNRRIAENIGGDVRLSIIPSGMHDLVLSPLPVRTIVYQNLFEWLNSRIFATKNPPV